MPPVVNGAIGRLKLAAQSEKRNTADNPQMRLPQIHKWFQRPFSVVKLRRPRWYGQNKLALRLVKQRCRKLSESPSRRSRPERGQQIASSDQIGARYLQVK